MSSTTRRSLVSRRSALRLMVTGTGVLLLTACGTQQAAPPSSGAAPTQAPAVPKPTEAPKPAAPAAPPTTAPAAAAAPKPTEVPKPAAAAPTSAPAPAAAKPKSGGTLRVGVSVDLDAAGFEAARLGPAYLPTVFPVFDTLTRFDKDKKPQPALAESWDLSSDAKQIKLNLRKGVTYHSGREFTSEDVKYNILRNRDPKVASGQLVGFSNWCKEIETPDKNTVILKFDDSRPTVFDYFEYFNLLDKDISETPDFRTKTGGTGPFSLVEWVQGSHIKLAKNKNYWQTGKPYVDEVMISIIKDPQAMAVQLEAGSLDAIMNPAVADGSRLQKDPKFQTFLGTPNGLTIFIILNTKMPPLDNKKLRQALSFAIDRQRFMDTVLMGLAGKDVKSLPWPAGSPADDLAKNAAYAFNLDKAKSLLNEAGFANGLELEIMYSSISSETAALSQIWAADLAKIGVKLTLKPMDSAAYMALARDRKLFIGVSDNSFSQLEPGTMFQLSGGYRPTGNTAQFESQKYIDLAIASQAEPDAAKRKALYDQINDLLLEESFNLAVSPRPWYMVTKKGVNGVGWKYTQSPAYENMWFE